MQKTFPWASDLAHWEWLPLKSAFNHLPEESGLELSPDRKWKMRSDLFVFSSEWDFFEKKPRYQKSKVAIFTQNEFTQKISLNETEARWLWFFSEAHSVEEFLEFVETPEIPTPESITLFFTNCSRFEWLINS